MDNTVQTVTPPFMTTNEISVIEKRVAPIVQEASQISITSTETLTFASTLREQIKEVINQVAESKEELYRPAKQAVDAINARYKPLEKPLDEALKLINTKMSEYQTAEVARAKAEADRIAARIGEGSGHYKIETALEKIDAIKKPDTLEATGFVNKPVLVITDEFLIPREYLIPDLKAIESDLKAGMVVPGAKMEDRLIPRTK